MRFLNPLFVHSGEWIVLTVYFAAGMFSCLHLTGVLYEYVPSILKFNNALN